MPLPLMLTILGALFFTTVCASSPAEDKPVPGSQLAREVKVKAGGKKAKRTLYPGVGHNSWSRAYANEEVYKWLLSHKTSGSTKK